MSMIKIKSKEDCLRIVYGRYPEWENDPKILEDLKAGQNEILSYLPDGIFDREWELLRIIDDEEDKLGEIGDYITTEGWVVPADFVEATKPSNQLTVEYNRVTSAFEVKPFNGSVLSFTPAEFWQIVSFGNHYDTKSEVEEYISQLEEPVNGVTSEQFLERIDEITDKVISDRVSDENGDQIYYVLEVIAREIKEETS